MKPKPVPTSLVCSLCGEPWDEHPENAKATDCVALLRAKLDAAPTFVPAPYPVHPYWNPPYFTWASANGTTTTNVPWAVIDGGADEDPDDGVTADPTPDKPVGDGGVVVNVHGSVTAERDLVESVRAGIIAGSRWQRGA